MLWSGRGIYILYEDVKSCPYEDVHVLWSILVESHPPALQLPPSKWLLWPYRKTNTETQQRIKDFKVYTCLYTVYTIESFYWFSFFLFYFTFWLFILFRWGKLRNDIINYWKYCNSVIFRQLKFPGWTM